MGLFKIDNIKAIKCKNCIGLIDGTFDYNYLYLVSEHSNKIIIFTEDLRELKRVKTSRAFDKITYDSYEKCFWCHSKFLSEKIFKLDEHMNEVGYIHIPNNTRIVKSINYNPNHNCITINLLDSIQDLNKFSVISDVINLGNTLMPYCTYCFDKFNLSLCKSDNANIISLFEEDNKIALFKLPDNIEFKSIIHVHINSNIIYIKILIYDENNCPYIANCSIDANYYFSSSKPNYYLEFFTYQCNELNNLISDN